MMRALRLLLCAGSPSPRRSIPALSLLTLIGVVRSQHARRLRANSQPGRCIRAHGGPIGASCVPGAASPHSFYCLLPILARDRNLFRLVCVPRRHAQGSGQAAMTKRTCTQSVSGPPYKASTPPDADAHRGPQRPIGVHTVQRGHAPRSASASLLLLSPRPPARARVATTAPPSVPQWKQRKGLQGAGAARRRGFACLPWRADHALAPIAVRSTTLAHASSRVERRAPLGASGPQASRKTTLAHGCSVPPACESRLGSFAGSSGEGSRSDLGRV